MAIMIILRMLSSNRVRAGRAARGIATSLAKTALGGRKPGKAPFPWMSGIPAHCAGRALRVTLTGIIQGDPGCGASQRLPAGGK